MEIKFTQYCLPDGRKKQIHLTCDDSECVRKAEALTDAGYELEIEILHTGEVSMTVERDCPVTGDREQLDHQVCSNGPAVPVHVKKLIDLAHAGLPAGDRDNA